jgi:uncharacterized repeat protein (TIGR02543 family)
MKKGKKITAVIVTAAVAAGAAGGIVYGVRASGRQPVMVVSASELNYGGGWYGSEMQGIVTSDVSQDIQLTDTQTVSEVLVKEGDTVKEGDVLLTYDTAMTSLNLEREKLNRQQIDLKVQVAQENLKKLRNTKPAADGGGSGTDGPGTIDPDVPGGLFPDLPADPEPTEEPTPDPTVTPTPEATVTPEPTVTPTPEPVSGYRLHFHANGHGTAPEEVTLKAGMSFQDHLEGLTEEERQSYLPAEEGYVFGGWYLDQICTVPFAPEEIPESDLELYARWTKASPDYSQAEALDLLTGESQPFNGGEGDGLGTAVNPYRYLCRDKAVITSEFMNEMRKRAAEAAAGQPDAHYYFMLEVHENDQVGGKLLKAWLQDASRLEQDFPENWQGTVNLASGTIEAGQRPEDGETAVLHRTKATVGKETAPEALFTAVAAAMEEGNYDSAGLGLIRDDMTYTKEELDAAIREQEETLKSLQLDQRESDLKVAQAEKAVADGVVRAKLNGVVRKAGDPKNPPKDGSPFLQVTSTEGMFVKGGISELRLNELKEGDTVTVMSWQSGAVCEAVVREISPYPDESGMFSTGDNASYYPFTAYIPSGTDGFSGQEWVSITASGTGGEAMGSPDALYLWKAFIREEGGEKYVYLRDENGRLKKQTITVGQLSGSGYEVLSGVSWEDWLAFPYGKDVREGAATREGSMAELYGY